MNESNSLDTQQLLEMLTSMQNQLTLLTNKIDELEDDLLLVSDIHHYRKLQKALKEKDWFEADLQTIDVILETAGKTKEELTPQDIQKFPITTLQVIDQLWRKYSEGRFGFGVQVGIYKRLGGTKDTTIAKDQSLLEKWGEQLGWREKNQWKRCEELNYTLAAPVGCHPSQWWNSPYGAKMTNFFLARLLDAHLSG
jgi:hypothetical protein